MALMNKRDALKYLAKHTSDSLKNKIKRTLIENYNEAVEKYGADKVGPMPTTNTAVRSYYKAVIDEAYGSHEFESILKSKKTQYIQTRTLQKAIKKIGNTDYVTTKAERYGKATRIALEEGGLPTSELRKKLGVSKIRNEYFKFERYDSYGNEIIRYEDKMIALTIIRNDKGETEDVKWEVYPLPYVGKARRYAKKW